MAHFAQLDDNNVVVQVIVVSNETLGNLPFPESEPVGVAFCQSLLGQDTVWKQTSYNSSFRVRYAGIGYTYSVSHDAFISPQPFPSWTLNETTLDWDPPVPYPDDGGMYVWDEATQTWVSV
jgi:hypothetical protein